MDLETSPNSPAQPTSADIQSAKLPALGSVIEVNDAGFKQLIATATTPVLVDFWAPGCGPCRTIAPVLDQLAKEYAGRLIIAKLDIADNPQTTVDQGISSIPTLKLFKNGQVATEMVGLRSKASLQKEIDKVVA